MHSRVSLLLPALFGIVAYLVCVSWHWQGAVNKIYHSLRPPEGSLVCLGEVTNAAATRLNIARVGTSVVPPKFPTAGSRSVLAHMWLR